MRRWRVMCVIPNKHSPNTCGEVSTINTVCAIKRVLCYLDQTLGGIFYRAVSLLNIMGCVFVSCSYCNTVQLPYRICINIIFIWQHPILPLFYTISPSRPCCTPTTAQRSLTMLVPPIQRWCCVSIRVCVSLGVDALLLLFVLCYYVIMVSPSHPRRKHEHTPMACMYCKYMYSVQSRTWDPPPLPLVVAVHLIDGFYPKPPPRHPHQHRSVNL